MKQLDDVLYLGGLSGTKDVGFQKFANSIVLTATTERIESFDPFEVSQDNLASSYSVLTRPFGMGTDQAVFDSNFYTIARGYRSPLYNVMKRGYMRDEVYAFYVAFVLNDGTMSYAYHIPGRYPLKFNYFGNWYEETDIIGDAPSLNLGAPAPPGTGDSWLQGLVDVEYWDSTEEDPNFFKVCGQLESLDFTIPSTAIDGGELNFFQFPENNVQNSQLVGLGPSFWPWLADDFNWPVDFNDTDLYQVSGGKGKIFHFYDTSYIDAPGSVQADFNENFIFGPLDDTGIGIAGMGDSIRAVEAIPGSGDETEAYARTNNMNYWENENEFYPDTDNFDIYVMKTGSSDEIGTLRGKKVRHHHFPSNENPLYRFIPEESTTGWDNWNQSNSKGRSKNTSDSVDFLTTSTPTDPEGQIVEAFEAEWVGMNPLIWEYNVGSSSSTRMLRFGSTSSNYATGTPAWTGPLPPVGACIYIEVNGGAAPLPDQGVTSSTDVGGNCDAWAFGKVIQSDGTGVTINFGSDAGFADATNTELGGIGNCLCTTDQSLGNNGFSTADHWDDMGIANGSSPCGNNPLLTMGFDCGCMGGGFLVGDGQNDNTNNIGGDNGDLDATTLYSGRAIWKIVELTNTSSPGNTWQQIGWSAVYNLATQIQAAEMAEFVLNGNNVNDFVNSGVQAAQGDYYVDLLEDMLTAQNFSIGDVYPDTMQGIYTTRDVSILGFHLTNIHIPEEIKDKVQGMRIYYAKRDHANRRILGQNLAIPMRNLESAIRGSCATAIEDPENLLNSENSNSNDLFTGNANSYASAPQSEKTGLWVCEGFPRDSEVMHWWDATGMCTLEGVNFHDFYLLRTHNSLSHATHMKIEYLYEGLDFMGPAEINLSCCGGNHGKLTEQTFDGDVITGVQTFDQTDTSPDNILCANMDMRRAFHIERYFTGTNNKRIKSYTRKMLNKVIRENAKTYLRGDSIYKATGVGFGYDIYNLHGESNIALQLRSGRGLPPLPAEANNRSMYNITSGDQNSQIPGTDTDAGSYAALGRDKWTFANNISAWLNGENSSKLWQTNLHAFKLDLYSNIDTNDLVFTGYEIIGDDFQNMNAEDGTKITYPEGVYGGDTFICRHGWRTTNRNLWDVGWTGDAGRGPQREDDFMNGWMTIVESSDNINLRHSGEKSNNADVFIPGTSVQEVTRLSTSLDLTYQPDSETGHIRYNDDYSLVNSIKTPIPLPLREFASDLFPTRIQRSIEADPTSIIDNWRIFLVNQFKDLPKHRGDLIALAAMNNILYFHMEDTLYKTVGKQKMEIAGGGDAFIGSGDLFEQDPEEVLQTYYGYGGTTSKYSSITTKAGYFYVDYTARKVFLLGQALSEISGIGLEEWFFTNIPFKLENTPFWDNNNKSIHGHSLDNPFHSWGFTSTWDTKIKRILLTKKELVPSRPLSYMLENNEAGWVATVDGDGILTMSFPDDNVPGWPTAFTLGIATAPAAITATFDEMVNLTEGYISGTSFVYNDVTLPSDVNFSTGSQVAEDISAVESLNVANYGGICTATLPENECAAQGGEYSIVDSVGLCCFAEDDFTTDEQNYFVEGGWTISYNPELQVWVSFHDYKPSTYILSGATLLSTDNRINTIYEHGAGPFGTISSPKDGTIIAPSSLEFVNNQAKDTDKQFANISYTADVQSIDGKINLHDPGFTSFYVYTTHQSSGEIDIEYLTNTRRVGNNWKLNHFRDLAALTDNATSEEIPIFITDGMDHDINENYIDTAKDDITRKKFHDKFLGICLKISNNSNNLVTLYSTEVAARKYFR